MRASTSTDAVIPSRMGIPTVCLTSLNRHKALSNYHSVTDVPANVNFATVAAVMSGSVIIDGRNALDPAAVAAAGLTYEGIGRS